MNSILYLLLHDVMNNTIKNLGQVTLAELPEDVDDSLSKNMLNAYF